MCLMLYIGTARTLPISSTPDLRIEAVEEARKSVRLWFSKPEVRFVGAHTGCSCGFPSVIPVGESPIAYYEGMPFESDNRSADLRSVRALLDLVGQVGRSESMVELYPIWNGEEAETPHGVLEWQFEALHADRFFFNEGFMHRVHFSDRPVDGSTTDRPAQR